MYTVRLNVGGARARHGGGRLSLLKLNWREAQPWKRSLDETKLRNSPQAAYKTRACVRVPLYRIDATKIDFSLRNRREREGEKERERDEEIGKESGDYLPANVHKLSFVEMREHERERFLLFRGGLLLGFFLFNCLLSFFS